MSFYAIAAEDRSFTITRRAGQSRQSARTVEILTPLVKGWCTEVAMESTSLGVQVHGGMGFIEETGAAQHMRDARILPIYEGTNGIQALDFVGRKCLRDGGEGLSALIADMAETASQRQCSAKYRDCSIPLNTQLPSASRRLIMCWLIPTSRRYLAYSHMMLFGNSVAYWLMVKQAIAAQKHVDHGSEDRFYIQKIATAQFFATQLLTRNYSHLATVTGGSSYLESLDEKDFSTL